LVEQILEQVPYMVASNGALISSPAQGDIALRQDGTAFLNKPMNVLTDFRSYITAGKLPATYVIGAYRYGNMMIITLGGAAIGTTITHGDVLMSIADCPYRSINNVFSSSPITVGGEIAFNNTGDMYYYDGTISTTATWLNFSLTYFCKGEQ
jgi:hypothetical protein